MRDVITTSGPLVAPKAGHKIKLVYGLNDLNNTHEPLAEFLQDQNDTHDPNDPFRIGMIPTIQTIQMMSLLYQNPSVQQQMEVSPTTAVTVENPVTPKHSLSSINASTLVSIYIKNTITISFNKK